MAEDLDYYVIIIYFEPLFGLQDCTYYVPIERVCTTSDAMALRDKLFKKLSSAVDRGLIRVPEKEYDIYYKLTNLRELMFYLPKLSSSKHGRDFDLEEEIKEEYIELMNKLGLNYERDTVVGIRELF